MPPWARKVRRVWVRWVRLARGLPLRWVAGEEGAALMVTVAAMALISTLGFMLVTGALAEQRISDQHMRSVQAFQAADGGAAEAISELDYRIKNYMPARVSEKTRMQDVWNLGYADLLVGYAYPPGEIPFTKVDGDRCRLVLHRDLETGSYDAVIEVWGLDRDWVVDVDEDYMWFEFGFSIESTGRAGDATRIARTEGTFRLHVSRLNFARFSLFTDLHRLPDYLGGGDVWFTNRTVFNGWVHTNEYFRIYNKPRFIRGPLTQVERRPEFWTAGRVDAYAVPPDEPQLEQGARFYRGEEDDITAIAMPSTAYSQLRAAAGLDFTDPSSPSNSELRAGLGLPVSEDPLPTDIYLAHSDAQNRITGGIVVAGDAWHVRFSVNADGNAVYTLRTRDNAVKVGSQWYRRAATITVDREHDQTTVVWDPFNGETDPKTRGKGAGTEVFNGVPNGVIYVRGGLGDRNELTGIQGMLGSQERVTVVADRTIYITGNLSYQSPPTGTADEPNANDAPNMLGLYCAGTGGAGENDIRIHSKIPVGDLAVHAVVMAAKGVYGVDGYSTIPVKGTVHHLGGVITKWYGAFGQFDPATGAPTHGYGRDFAYDYRMEKTAPPVFPTTGRLVSYTEGGLKIWREEVR